MDDLDRQMIAALRADGRAPLSKLAKILGVARGTVQARLDRLQEAGIITGFAAQLRHAHDDGSVRAVMMIEMSGKLTTTIVRKLKSLPQVETLHSTNGTWDLVAGIRAGGLAEFDRVLLDIRAIDGILNSETSILLSAL